MNLRITLYLLLAVLFSGAFIWLMEESPQKIAYRESRGKVVFDLSMETLSRLGFQSSSNKLECLREGRHWEIVEPVVAPVAAGEMERIISGLESVEKVRTIELDADEIPAESLKKYGFENPRLEISFSDNRGRRSWLVGRSTPLGNEIFVMRKGANQILVVRDEFMELLPRGYMEIRDRTVFCKGASDVVRVDINRQNGFLQLVKKSQNQWYITQPIVARAQNEPVSVLLQEICALDIAKFVTEEVSDLSVFGLQNPKTQISLTSGSRVSRGLILGDPLPDNPDLVYGKMLDDYSVFAVERKISSVVGIETESLYDRNLLTIDSSEISGVEIRRNDKEVSLSKKGSDEWWVSAPRVWSADSQRIADMLDCWTRGEILDFVDSASIDDLEHSFGDGAWEIAFSSEELEEPVSFQISTNAWKDEHYLVRRVEEGVCGLVSAQLLDLLDDNPLFYKDRKVLNFDPATVQKLTRVEHGSAVIAERDEAGEFKLLKGGLEDSLHSDNLDRILNIISSLKAVTYLKPDSSPANKYGLQNPRVGITIALKESDKIGLVLSLGKADARGRYAKLRGDDVPFLISTADARGLTAELVQATPQRESEK